LPSLFAANFFENSHSLAIPEVRRQLSDIAAHLFSEVNAGEAETSSETSGEDEDKESLDRGRECHEAMVRQKEEEEARRKKEEEEERPLIESVSVDEGGVVMQVMTMSGETIELSMNPKVCSP
jgi:hypothetical protein